MTVASSAHLEECVNSIAINLWRNEELFNNVTIWGKWDMLLLVTAPFNM